MSAAPDIGVARVYDDRPAGGGRARLLVDRLWPRGVARAGLGLDAWLKDIAPTHELRRWFGHDPARAAEFARRYRAELDANPAAVAAALAWVAKGPVTLLYAARERELNQAHVLRDYLLERLHRPGPPPPPPPREELP